MVVPNLHQKLFGRSKFPLFFPNRLEPPRSHEGPEPRRGGRRQAAGGPAPGAAAAELRGREPGERCQGVGLTNQKEVCFKHVLICLNQLAWQLKCVFSKAETVFGDFVKKVSG